jgi:hypothetical protein
MKKCFHGIVEVQKMSNYKEMESFMQFLARNIDHDTRQLYGKKGFVLLLFEFGEPAIANYVSNANRQDIIKTLRETADRLEKSEDMPAVIGGVQ